MPTSTDYVELHCHSAYSFLDGASDPAELAATAADLGLETLALTDHDNVCGAMEFAHACAGVGVRPIVGCELTVEVPRRMPRPVHVTLLVEDARGWASLCRLITEAHRGTREPASRSDGSRSRTVAMREALPPRSRSTSSSATPRGWSASRAVPAMVPWRGPGSGVIRPAPRISRRRLRAPSDRTTSGSSCSGRSGATTGRATAGSPRWRRSSGCPPWRRATPTPTTVPALPLQDAMVAVRLGATLDETEGLRRGNSASALLSAERAVSALPRPPGGGDRDGAARRSPALRPHQ